MDLCARAGKHRIPSRGVSLVTPKEMAAAGIAALRWWSDVSPNGSGGGCQHGMYLPVPVAQHMSPEASRLPRLSPAFDYLLKRFDTG